jgi:hypothetical protein
MSFGPDGGLMVAIAIGGGVYLWVDGISPVERRLGEFFLILRAENETHRTDHFADNSRECEWCRLIMEEAYDH